MTNEPLAKIERSLCSVDNAVTKAKLSCVTLMSRAMNIWTEALVHELKDIISDLDKAHKKLSDLYDQVHVLRNDK